MTLNAKLGDKLKLQDFNVDVELFCGVDVGDAKDKAFLHATGYMEDPAEDVMPDVKIASLRVTLNAFKQIDAGSTVWDGISFDYEFSVSANTDDGKSISFMYDSRTGRAFH